MSEKSIEGKLTSEKGLYILDIVNKTRTTNKIGSLGEIEFPYGLYFYIGSALGPGGIKERVKRHLRDEKKKHWHIDYFLALPDTTILNVWGLPNNDMSECEIAETIRKTHTETEISTIKNFGSSDCNCEGHLLYLHEFSLKIIYEQFVKLGFKVIFTR